MPAYFRSPEVDMMIEDDDALDEVEERQQYRPTVYSRLPTPVRKTLFLLPFIVVSGLCIGFGIYGWIRIFK